MSDPADESVEYEELQRVVGIAAVKQEVKVMRKGFCYNCLETLENKKACYCDPECREDHEARVRKAGATWVHAQ